MLFTPTHAAAAERLASFLPHIANYSFTRNFDNGPEDHCGVSQLSPYIRTRLVTEEEITRAVLQHHSAESAGKFLQEIAWRTYWKGWLEMRPEVWSHYRETLASAKKCDRYHDAVSGNARIDCFDFWARELLETGYLHNHARMWFASIWIFTLKLPWQLGADFFLKNLLDGDPASNTLSWRWVAGLQTKGKHYLARAENIEKFTKGRFNPVGLLDESVKAIFESKDFVKQDLNFPEKTYPKGRVGHLMLPEDLAQAPTEIGKIAAIAAFIPPVLKTTPLVSQFLDGAVVDTMNRANGTLLEGPFESAVMDWISAEKLDSIIISLPTVGLTKDFLVEQKLPLTPQFFVRGWDRQLWPHATAGFFRFRKSLPDFFASLS